MQDCSIRLRPDHGLNWTRIVTREPRVCHPPFDVGRLDRPADEAWSLQLVHAEPPGTRGVVLLRIRTDDLEVGTAAEA